MVVHRGARPRRTCAAPSRSPRASNSHPGGPGEVAALAATPSGRVVVWLDELQRYLDGEGGLGGGVVRALLGQVAAFLGTRAAAADPC